MNHEKFTKEVKALAAELFPEGVTIGVKIRDIHYNHVDYFNREYFCTIHAPLGVVSGYCDGESDGENFSFIAKKAIDSLRKAVLNIQEEERQKYMQLKAKFETDGTSI